MQFLVASVTLYGNNGWMGNERWAVVRDSEERQEHTDKIDGQKQSQIH